MDGRLLVDAHVHVAKLRTLSEDWQSWARTFGAQTPLDALFDADGVPVPVAIDEHFANQGADHVLLFTEHSPKVTGIQPIEDVLPVVRQNPQRFHPIANLNPHLHYPVAAELARQVDLGAIAVKIHPVHGGFEARDRMLYPAYARAEERGLPVIVHCGTSTFAGSVNSYADPILLDEVFRDFPDLIVVLAHGGRGWWYDQAAFLALMKPNVWIEVSGLPPQRLASYYGSALRRLADKMIFGTDWPGVPSVQQNARVLEKTLLEAGCTDDQVTAALGGNAVSVFRLGSLPAACVHTEFMQAEVVIIGAGALGLSTALHCAIAGRSVIVVERETAGSQASGRAAGLFKSVQADELRTRLARRSIDLAVSFGDWAGVPLPVTRSGSYLIARTRAHSEYLRIEAAQSAGWGVALREADASEIADKVSYYEQSASTTFALWCPEDVYIAEPIELINAYVAAARLRGVEILEHESVTAITLSGPQVAGVETSRRSITCPVVVDAAGAWTRQVAEFAGAAVALAPVRHQLLITEPTNISHADPIVRVVDAAVYLRPARGGLMVGGFETGPLAFDVSAPPAEMPLDRAVLDGLAEHVGPEVPMARRPVAEHRGGMFTMSPDGRFVLGSLPDVPGLWVASGCNGSGFSSSPALGEALAGQITGGSAPDASVSGGSAPDASVSGASASDTSGELAALSPGRFGPYSDNALISEGVWQYEHYYEPQSFEPQNYQP